ncbi:flavodoxin domain-containing protein [Glaciecola sp. MH2013]|uniref:flavodoxin domain-containing protein n=1 Tax=Glaciecola sp. MH2013 TaxID=2785524 RepID=UPI00189FA6C8|nr:flavodoxin domain-containing protein [Glaciecola sp. MH2013]MBF7074649.1 flavodoxin domain-containing protein [Glaciecola sp. MH2013]
MHFDIVVGSVLGASEYVAEALQATAEEAGHKATCHFEPTLADISAERTLVVCTSTHGAGDLPDNIQAFANDLKSLDMTNFSVLIVGLGDSSYDTYCGAAIQMEELLSKQKATLLTPALHIDVLHHPIPEDTAVEWFTKFLSSSES